MQRRTSVLFVSPALSAMPTGPVERVATRALSSAFEPGFVCAPHRPQACGSVSGLPLQFSGRCVQNMSLDGRTPKAKPRREDAPMFKFESCGNIGNALSSMP